MAGISARSLVQTRVRGGLIETQTRDPIRVTTALVDFLRRPNIFTVAYEIDFTIDQFSRELLCMCLVPQGGKIIAEDIIASQ